MAKGLTPIIGLAVVVALAMVAVFGAMSLTNPAFAAVGAPADSQMAEQVGQPQQATVTVYAGGATAPTVAAAIALETSLDITTTVNLFGELDSSKTYSGQTTVSLDRSVVTGFCN